MSEIPDRINIDKKDRLLYKQLDKEEMLRFKGGRRTRKEQFLFAMAYGFKNRVKRPLETKEGWFLAKDLQPDDETLLNTISIYETGSVNVLSDKGEVFRIAEEYAHAGLKLLCDKIISTSFGSFDKKFEKEIQEIYKKIKLDNK